VSKQFWIFLLIGLAIVGAGLGLVLLGTDPSDVPFVLKGATLSLEPASGAILEGMTVSKPDLENVFQYNPILGPKFNDVLGIKDKIAPHQRIDRMVGARFEIPESAAEDRKAIYLHIEEMNGVTADLVEKK
jgi:hypothetical protein